MNWTKNIAIIAIVLVFTACAGKKYAIDQVDKEEVLASIRLVNTYWQTNNKPQHWAFWDEAAYHTGNMAAYEVTKDSAALNYSVLWADYNQWKGAKSSNREDWKYNYGEGDDYVLFGDWQICFQTYIDLYHLHPDEVRIHRAKEVMEYQMSTLVNDYWWWADGLYMVMPVMTKLYNVTKNHSYLDKLNTYFRYADSLMFDQDAHLYYRDGKYLFPKHKSTNGKRDFWARGDGWVLAGLAKVLADLPKDYKHRPFFEQRFQQLAKAVADAQQPEGYWTRSLLDAEHAPGPETSGTAFFTYGLLWGVNNGYLNAAEYLPVIDRSWRYLQDIALQADGSVGYVQPIGEKAIPGQVVDQNSTTNFGVGAYLLAATELYKYLDQ